jgi:hypothetical protein
MASFIFAGLLVTVAPFIYSPLSHGIILVEFARSPESMSVRGTRRSRLRRLMYR